MSERSDPRPTCGPTCRRPELGPVEPVLWSELEAGLDGLMLAMGGGWLKNIADAVRAYERLELFTAAGLETARRGRTPVFC